MSLGVNYKYLIRNYKVMWLIFGGLGLAMELLAVLAMKWLNTSGDSGTFSGVDFSGMITCFIMGITCFKEDFHMLVQNGVSRKATMKAGACMVVTSSVIMTLINLLLRGCFQLLFGSQEKFQWLSVTKQLYGTWFQSAGTAVQFMMEIFWFFTASLLFAVFSYFCGALFYRLGKMGRILFCAGVPVTLFIIWPLLDMLFFNGRTVRAVLSLIGSVMGFSSQNPLLGILTFAGLVMVSGGAVYLLVSKMELKK